MSKSKGGLESYMLRQVCLVTSYGFVRHFLSTDTFTTRLQYLPGTEVSGKQGDLRFK